MNEENTKFLESLKAYNKENLSADIWVPSLEREVTFLPMTAKHQKYVIHSTLDNPIFGVIFRQKSYDMIKELCEEQAIVDTLTVFDKDAILIQFRYHFVSKEYKGKSMKPLLKAIKKIKEDFSPIQNTKDGFKIDYCIPTILEERNLYKAYSKTDSYVIAPDDDNQIREMVSELYMLELVKYVTKMTIVDKDISMSFKGQPIAHVLDIAEHVGKEVCNKIQDTIEAMIDDHSPMYQIDDDTRVEINPELFT
tara:strand:- start:30171 stop:30923 length:753 start_codon:yes stop_codon:yes gene_type:complete